MVKDIYINTKNDIVQYNREETIEAWVLAFFFPDLDDLVQYSTSLSLSMSSLQRYEKRKISFTKAKETLICPYCPMYKQILSLILCAIRYYANLVGNTFW